MQIDTLHFKVKHVALAALLAHGTAVHAVELLDGFGGDIGYGEQALLRNDDASSNPLTLPFTVNFFGNRYDSFWINNNGSVTFNGSLEDFTPEAFPIVSQPMIAPYWADVDTTGGGPVTMNNVWVAAPNPSTVVVTWNQVGYFDARNDKLNDFQLVLTDASGQPGATQGDFDVQFRYNQLTWTTGEASEGVDGLGGIPAQAGYDAGNGTDFFVLPGSRTDAVLDLANTSNVSANTPGLWEFAIRNGRLPGDAADNPLLPTLDPDASPLDGFHFNFGVDLDQLIFLDPVVATGFDFVLNSGPGFASVLLPDIGDGLYELWLWDGSAWFDSGTVLTEGVAYDFGPDGERRFSIRGIETSAALDPQDPLAFVTGLTFVAGGTVDLNMLPVTTSIPPAVPEPAAALLMLPGLALLGLRLRRRKAAARPA